MVSMNVKDREMKNTFMAIIALLTFAGVVSAKMVEREITPGNAADHKWNVATTRTGKTTTFTVSIPFKGDALPKGTSASLDVFDGKTLVSRSTLQIQSEGGKTYFRFTVGNDFLADSKFVLQKIAIPHPSGDIYWANLKKFAERKGKNP